MTSAACRAGRGSNLHGQGMLHRALFGVSVGQGCLLFEGGYASCPVLLYYVCVRHGNIPLFIGFVDISYGVVCAVSAKRNCKGSALFLGVKTRGF